MVIEDSKNGFESAKMAGLECLKIKELVSLIKKLPDSWQTEIKSFLKGIMEEYPWL